MSIDRFSPAKMAGIQYTLHTIQTEDGLTLNLHRYKRSEEGDSLLLLHGLSSSSNMFNSGEWHNITYFMLGNGCNDLWLFDWRRSYHYREWTHKRKDTMDEVVRFDVPTAVSYIQQRIRGGLHCIGHCIGAMVLSMALAAKLIVNIKSLISVSVSLYPKLELISFLKLYTVPGVAESLLNMHFFEVDPDRVDFQEGNMLLYEATNLSRNGCHNPTCRALSFIWGSGHGSTIFHHENLHPYTHDHLHEQFGPVATSYFRHLQKMLQHQSVISMDEQTHYLDLVGNIDVPILLATGKDNRCWYDSNQEFHSLLSTYFPKVKHELFVVPNYYHNDVFMGKHSWTDVFPRVLSFLKSVE